MAAGIVLPPVWQGTAPEWDRLQEAVRANCAERERFDAENSGSRCYACPSCLLLMDQAGLDRLVFTPWACFIDAEHREREGRIA